MYQALQSRSSFNVIHFATAFKIDIFVQGGQRISKADAFTTAERCNWVIAKRSMSFVSPEDIILLKLDWFRQSGGSSERQWSDVQGVLAGQGKSLDFEYLKNWAKKLELDGTFSQSNYGI